jgi:hypothetical protein
MILNKIESLIGNVSCSDMLIWKLNEYVTNNETKDRSEIIKKRFEKYFKHGIKSIILLLGVLEISFRISLNSLHLLFLKYNDNNLIIDLKG